MAENISGLNTPAVEFRARDSLHFESYAWGKESVRWNLQGHGYICELTFSFVFILSSLIRPSRSITSGTRSIALPTFE